MEDFARFNDVDAYIENDSFTAATTGAWRLEYDIRLHRDGVHYLLCASDNTLAYVSQTEFDVRWHNRAVAFPSNLNLEQWYHVDFRYNWDAADGLYRVSIDGGPDETNAGTNSDVDFDRYAKRGAQLPLADCDLKNVLLEDGTDVSSIVLLDQKLQINACDDGPDSRDGTTFDMDLPSCP